MEHPSFNSWLSGIAWLCLSHVIKCQSQEFLPHVVLMLVHNWARSNCFTGSHGLKNKLFNLSGVNSFMFGPQCLLASLPVSFQPPVLCQGGTGSGRKSSGLVAITQSMLNQCIFFPFVSPAFRWVEFCLPSGSTSQPLERRVAGIVSPSYFIPFNRLNNKYRANLYLLFIMYTVFLLLTEP